MNIKRLFFGFSAEAPWGEEPQGRHLLEEDRHVTALFLGSFDLDALPKVPEPSWKVGFVCLPTKMLFLPRCVALELEEDARLTSYQKEISNLFPKEKRSFLPHVTLARAPFSKSEWHFKKIPISITNFNLYESLGNSRYKKLWTHNIAAPFEEVPHVADIAFKVRGETLEDLSQNAFYALASRAPGILNYPYDLSLEMIPALNAAITRLDIEEGSPLKAVSYHGTITKMPDYFEWEMIVDV